MVTRQGVGVNYRCSELKSEALPLENLHSVHNDTTTKQGFPLESKSNMHVKKKEKCELLDD